MNCCVCCAVLTLIIAISFSCKGATVQDDVDLIVKIDSLVNDIESDLKNVFNETGCNCKSMTCDCCLNFGIPDTEIRLDTCVSVTYLPNDYGIDILLTINNAVVINETISARSPPAMCFGGDYTFKIVEGCLKFYNLDVSKVKFSGCAKLFVEVENIKVLQFVLGCFRIPPKGAKKDNSCSQRLGKYIAIISALKTKSALMMAIYLPKRWLWELSFFAPDRIPQDTKNFIEFTIKNIRSTLNKFLISTFRDP